MLYWRLVHGHASINDEGWTDAHKRADMKVKALGRSKNRAAEIEAYKEGWSEAGFDVASIDYLPKYSRTLQGTERGWAEWRQPGTTAMDLSYLRDRAVVHSTGYGGGGHFKFLATADWNDSLLANTERQRVGFLKRVGASPERDLQTGGGSSFFGRLVKTNVPRGGVGARGTVVLNLGRQFQKLETYVAPSDTFGRINQRSMSNTVSARRYTAFASRGGNEIMMRRGLTLFDDVEILFRVVCSRTG